MKTTPVLFVLLLAMMKLPMDCGKHGSSSTPAAIGTNAPVAHASADLQPQVKPLPVPATGPSVAIISPVKYEVIDSTDIGVFLKAQDLPEDRGAHVHIILDNQPPEEVADPMLPVVFRRVKPGLHVVRAFACDDRHVSFKNAAALAMVWFKVAGEGENVALDPKAPTLTFNLPAPACARAAAQKLPVDFLLGGVAMDDLKAWRVRVSLDGGQQVMLDASNYLDVFLPPLEAGEHAVRLELLDGQGRPLRANFAWNERVVRVR